MGPGSQGRAGSHLLLNLQRLGLPALGLRRPAGLAEQAGQAGQGAPLPLLGRELSPVKLLSPE